jgi:hypothetical protein
MPAQTGVIDKRFALTAITLIQMSAQCGSSTGTDVSESLELAVRQRRPPVLQKLLFLLTKDIGHF